MREHLGQARSGSRHKTSPGLSPPCLMAAVRAFSVACTLAVAPAIRSFNLSSIPKLYAAWLLDLVGVKLTLLSPGAIFRVPRVNPVTMGAQFTPLHRIRIAVKLFLCREIRGRISTPSKRPI